MNHPELIAVPILMLADYALTVLGAKSSAAVYRKHFVSPFYELNPMWRKSVDRTEWFNLRHTALVVLVAVLLVLIDQMDVPPDGIFELMLGMLFGAFGSVCGRHLSNLMLFGYLNRHPQEVSGQVHVSTKLALRISQYTYVGLIPLFIILVALVPTWYTYGVLVGLIAMVVAHFRWARKAKSAEAPSQQAVQPELVHTFESTIRFVERSVADLSEQEMVEQPAGVPNHGTWTLGHIIYSCHEVAAELGAERWLPDDWESAFGYDSTPFSDLSRYPNKSEMLALLADAASRLRDALLAATDAVLRQSLPDETMLTMGDLLHQIVAAHTAYHAGQLAAWRRAIGKESAAVFI